MGEGGGRVGGNKERKRDGGCYLGCIFTCRSGGCFGRNVSPLRQPTCLSCRISSYGRVLAHVVRWSGSSPDHLPCIDSTTGTWRADVCSIRLFVMFPDELSVLVKNLSDVAKKKTLDPFWIFWLKVRGTCCCLLPQISGAGSREVPHVDDDVNQ